MILQEYINKNTIVEDGHLIWTGPKNIRETEWGKVYRTSTPHNLVRISRGLPGGGRLRSTCNKLKCVHPDHYEKYAEGVHREYVDFRGVKEKHTYLTNKSITVHRDIFWHMDKMDMLDWRVDPPRLKRTGHKVRKY